MYCYLGLKRKYQSLLAMALLPLLSATGCTKPSAAESPPAPTAPPAVAIVKPERKTLRRTLDQPAYLEAFEEAPLYVKIPGYVQSVNVDIGDAVKTGDLLAELSVPELEQELKQKEALVLQAEAEVAHAEESVKVGQAGVATGQAMVVEAEAGRTRATANYERNRAEYKRVQDLVQRRVIEEQIREETLNQLKSSESSRDELEAKVKSMLAACQECTAKLNKMRAEVNSAKARLEVARADRQRVASLLDYTKVRAPFAGVITRRHVNTGHFLQPPNGNGSHKSDPLFVVMRADPIRIFLDVPEADAVCIRNGAKARIRIQGLQGEELEGKVTRSSWALDPRERTMRTEIDLANPAGKLRPGMYAHVHIDVEHASVMTLPSAAILTQDNQTYCYCVEQDKAVRTRVRLGAREGDSVEVLKKQAKSTKPGDGAWLDISGDEVVVAKSPGTISEGQTIKP